VIQAEWVGGPNDGSVMALPDGTQRYQMTVQHPVMLNGQPIPGEYVAEQVSCPVTPGGATGHRIIWHA
jgi:hypothetical protein